MQVRIGIEPGMGVELLFVLAIGLLLLGPRHLHTAMRRAAQGKREWEKTSRSIRTQVAAEFSPMHSDGESDARPPEAWPATQSTHGSGDAAAE